MHNSAQPPIPSREFYILLVLTQSERYGHGIRNSVQQISHGAVIIPDNRLYPLLGKLVKDGLIADAGLHPAGPSYVERKHYKLSNLGRIHLEEEYARLKFALEVMAAAGIGQPALPPDVQRLLDSVS